MLKSVSKFFNSGFKAEFIGVILLIFFFYLLLSRAGESFTIYEFITPLLWMSFITAICLWIQSIRFFKNAIRKHSESDFKLSAATAMCLGVMFMAGSAIMQNIPAMSAQYLIIALASVYGLALCLFSAASLRRAAQQ